MSQIIRRASRTPDLGMKIKLTKLAKLTAASEPCRCSMDGAMWLGGYHGDEEEVSPPSRFDVRFLSPAEVIVSYAESGVRYQLVGVPLGQSIINVSWDWYWSSPDAAEVFAVKIFGQFLAVTWEDFSLVGLSQPFSLTAQASCMSVPSATLTLHFEPR